MKWSDARLRRIRHALEAHGLDAIVCALPANVLMLSGYWPIVGTAVAIGTRDGTVVLAPKDEEQLAHRGFAKRIETFEAGSLRKLQSAADGVEQPIAQTMRSLGLVSARIGIESGEWVEASPYASLHLYGDRIAALLQRAAPGAQQVDAHEMLTELRAVQTCDEIEHIRVSCRTAARAFEQGGAALRAGLSEVEAAANFRRPLYVVAGELIDAGRADGFVFCMSGENAAAACGAYARSRSRRIAGGDLVLVHCNSYVDGYWTDITRTFCVGPPTSRQREMYEAAFAARHAALSSIRPGVRAADVDRAARDVLTQRGFGDAFKHPTGHGVGFAAIDHNALPRLHPKSPDVLEEGMVFNVEPGIYLDDQGMRHCDMVAVTPDGCELLTPFQGEIDALVAAGQ